MFYAQCYFTNRLIGVACLGRHFCAGICSGILLKPVWSGALATAIGLSRRAVVVSAT